MAWFLLPISILTKSFIHMPSIFGLLPTYIFTIYCMFQLSVKRYGIGELYVNKKVILFTVMFILVQTIVMAISSLTMHPLVGTPKFQNGCLLLILIIFSYFLSYYTVYLSISDFKQISFFVKSVYITFVVFFIFILLPQIISVLFNISFFNEINNVISSLLAAKHIHRLDFYSCGSYVTTLHRINGLSEEASFFAAEVGIIFAPFILSGIKNKINVFTFVKKKFSLSAFILLLILFSSLFLAKTTTGLLVIIICSIFLYSWIMKNYPVQTIIFTLIFLLLFFVAYIKIHFIHSVLNNYLFKKRGTSNRLGSTIALFITFLHHPIFGVGHGYTSPYSFLYVPRHLTDNFEYDFFFKKYGFAAQSNLMCILAEVGLVFILPLFIYIFKKLKLYKRTLFQLDTIIHSNDKLNQFNKFNVYKLILDAFPIFIFLYLFLMLFSFSYLDYCYLIMFAFYFVVIKLIIKDLSNES